MKKCTEIMNPIMIKSVGNNLSYEFLTNQFINENFVNNKMDIQIHSSDNVYYIIKGEDDNVEDHTILNQTIPASINQFDPISDIEIDVNFIADPIQAFKCKYCNFIVENRLSMLAHCREEHIEKFISFIPKSPIDNEKQEVRYVCGICSKSLLSLQECQQHMIHDHNFKNVSSDTENEDNKLDIMKIENNKNLLNPENEYWLVPKTYKEIKEKLKYDRTIRCTEKYCVYKFNSLEAMTTHKNCHTTGSSNDKSPHKQSSPKSNHFYTCTVCQKKFVNWPSCSLHLWKTHSIQLDLLTCPICSNLKTHSISKMNQHLACHWRKNPTKNDCGICTTKIAESTESLTRWYAKKKCDICSKMFSNSKTLKKHIQAVHKKIKPFSCNVCGHSSSSKHTLQLHIRQHTGEKPYSCDFCDYRTSDHNTLRRHKMKHTAIRPYKCSYCTYSSIQSMPLKMHLKLRHPGKPPPTCLHTKQLDNVNNKTDFSDVVQ